MSRNNNLQQQHQVEQTTSLIFWIMPNLTHQIHISTAIRFNWQKLHILVLWVATFKKWYCFSVQDKNTCFGDVITEVRELLLKIGIIRLIIRDNLQLARSKQSYSTEHKLNIFITRQRGRRRGAAVKPGQLKLQLE